MLLASYTLGIVAGFSSPACHAGILAMPPICYRDFQDGDLEAVATIWHESWHSMALSIASPLATEQECQERIRRELANGWRVTVACSNDQVVGFLAIRPGQEPGQGVLDQIFISPGAKGQGIGTALLRRAMAEMSGGFWLRCAAANAAACAFYETRKLRRDHTEPHPVLGHATVIYVWP